MKVFLAILLLGIVVYAVNARPQKKDSDSNSNDSSQNSKTVKFFGKPGHGFGIPSFGGPGPDDPLPFGFGPLGPPGHGWFRPSCGRPRPSRPPSTTPEHTSELPTDEPTSEAPEDQTTTGAPTEANKTDDPNGSSA